mmetsp:Transcript_12418/g.28048  ORF Transcript_12418/g.28048 Transcript_12418/m.28048 type:complete len:86 (+) Transcript_12418:167-424(+)
MPRNPRFLLSNYNHSLLKHFGMLRSSVSSLFTRAIPTCFKLAWPNSYAKETRQYHEFRTEPSSQSLEHFCMRKVRTQLEIGEPYI